ncbi:MAG: RbsD/FucU domain-containing protein [Bacteroidota bacterium]
MEKLILAKEAQQVNPTHFNKVSRVFGQEVEVETIPHAQLKKLSYKVKAIIRTGDFTANGNIILVSGAGSRWYLENP